MKHKPHAMTQIVFTWSVHTHCLSCWNVQCFGSGLPDEAVLKLYAGEGTPSHDRIVSSPCAVGIKLTRGQTDAER